MSVGEERVQVKIVNSVFDLRNTTLCCHLWARHFIVGRRQPRNRGSPYYVWCVFAILKRTISTSSKEASNEVCCRLSNQTARKTSSTCCCHCSQIPTKRSGEPIIVVVRTTPRPRSPPWRRRSPSWRTPTSPAATTPVTGDVNQV